MAWTAWSDETPPDSEAVSNGATRIRDLKNHLAQRLGDRTQSETNGITDQTGTRTIDSEPAELRPGIADTAALEAGAVGAVGRAVTYFDRVSIAAGTGDWTHAGTGTASLLRQWEAITGMVLTIPNTVLNTTGVIEHTNGTAITSSNYVIFIVAILNVDFAASSTSDRGILRIYNATNLQVVSMGDNAAVGAAASDGIATLKSSIIGGGTNTTQNIVLVGRDTARTAETRYEVHGATISGTAIAADPSVNNAALRARFTLCPAEMYALVFKR